MGQEAHCVARLGGKTFKVKALLETSELVVRGELRLSVRFTDMTGAEAEGDTLAVHFAGGILELDLGPLAARWAERIRNPKSRADKLGVKAGQRVAVLGEADADLLAELAAAGVTPARRLVAACDLIFYAVDTVAELGRLPALRARLVPAGAVWVLHPKGRGAAVRDVDVMAAARAAGLVDNKVAAFSAARSALRLVIPRAQR